MTRTFLRCAPKVSRCPRLPINPPRWVGSVQFRRRTTSRTRFCCRPCRSPSGHPLASRKLLTIPPRAPAKPRCDKFGAGARGAGGESDYGEPHDVGGLLLSRYYWSLRVARVCLPSLSLASIFASGARADGREGTCGQRSGRSECSASASLSLGSSGEALLVACQNRPMPRVPR